MKNDCEQVALHNDEYFICDKSTSERRGPFNRNQLVYNGLCASTMILGEGMSEPREAFKITQLSHLFSKEEVDAVTGQDRSKVARIIGYLVLPLLWLTYMVIIPSFSGIEAVIHAHAIVIGIVLGVAIAAAIILSLEKKLPMKIGVIALSFLGIGLFFVGINFDSLIPVVKFILYVFLEFAILGAITYSFVALLAWANLATKSLPIKIVTFALGVLAVILLVANGVFENMLSATLIVGTVMLVFAAVSAILYFSSLAIDRNKVLKIIFIAIILSPIVIAIILTIIHKPINVLFTLLVLSTPILLYLSCLAIDKIFPLRKTE